MFISILFDGSNRNKSHETLFSFTIWLRTGSWIVHLQQLNVAPAQDASETWILRDGGIRLAPFSKREEIMTTNDTTSHAGFRPIDARTCIGHVHLKVADLERAIAFYSGVLGFEITQRYGRQAAFLSAGGYHHHIGLNTWDSSGGSPPPRGTTGLFHLAIRYPTRRALADAVRRLIAAGIAIDGASDHGVSEAIYLRDPDENGVELYFDRPSDQWPRSADGSLQMGTTPLDLQGLMTVEEA